MNYSSKIPSRTHHLPQDASIDASRSSATALVNRIVERSDMESDIAFWIHAIRGDMTNMSEGDRIIALRIRRWYQNAAQTRGYVLDREIEPLRGWGRVRAFREDINAPMVRLVDIILQDILPRALEYTISLPGKNAPTEKRQPQIILAHEYDYVNAGVDFVARYRLGGRACPVGIQVSVSDDPVKKGAFLSEDGLVTCAHYNIKQRHNPDFMMPKALWIIKPVVVARMLDECMELVSQDQNPTPDDIYCMFERTNSESGVNIRSTVAQLQNNVKAGLGVLG